MEYDKYKKAAHAYCILNMNKELIYKVDVRQRYDTEEKMPKRWTFQLFFKDTYSKKTNKFGKLSSSSSSSDGVSGEFDGSSQGGGSSALATAAKKFKIKCQTKVSDQPEATLNAQSPFIRVLCNEQRVLAPLQTCHCQKDQKITENLTQCQSCHNWYH